jgi:hypothetical protein
LGQKGRCQIGLGIEVNGQHALAHFGKHPSQVKNQRGLSQATFVIKKVRTEKLMNKFFSYETKPAQASIRST